MSFARFIIYIQSKVLDYGCSFAVVGAGSGAINLPIATYKEFKQKNNKIGMYVATPIMIPVGALGGGVCGLAAGLFSPFIAAGAVVVVFKIVNEL